MGLCVNTKNRFNRQPRVGSENRRRKRYKKLSKPTPRRDEEGTRVAGGPSWALFRWSRTYVRLGSNGDLARACSTVGPWSTMLSPATMPVAPLAPSSLAGLTLCTSLPLVQVRTIWFLPFALPSRLLWCWTHSCASLTVSAFGLDMSYATLISPCSPIRGMSARVWVDMRDDRGGSAGSCGSGV